MITLFRWYLYKAKLIKWKLAIMQEFDRHAMKIIKEPDYIEKKILPYIAELIHQESSKENTTK